MKLIRNALADNSRWLEFRPRPDDIVVCAPPKCGTTWIQTIIATLLWPKGNLPGPITRISPWIEARWRPVDEMHAMLQQQTHRRFLKSHMAADCLPWYESTKYIFVARDGRDAFMSWHNHIQRIRALDLINAAAKREKVPILAERDRDIHRFFEEWISNGDNFLNIVASYWAQRANGNLLIVHFNDLKDNLSSEMSRIAEFLSIGLPQTMWASVVERCTFDGMRSRANELGELKASLSGGIKGLLFKGTNGRWRGVLSKKDLAMYRGSIRRALPPEAAVWIERGRASMA